MRKNIAQPGRLQYGACALDAGYLRLQTHTEYKIITAFPLQQWLHECASMLRYTYIVCLVTSAVTTEYVWESMAVDER